MGNPMNAPAMPVATEDARPSGELEHLSIILGRVIASAISTATRDPELRAAITTLHRDVLQSAAAPAVTDAKHVTRAQYARSRGISIATVSRLEAEGMPTIPVGSTVRIEPVAADEWRRARGRRPTKAAPKREPELDVDADLARAGLRLVGGAR